VVSDVAFGDQEKEAFVGVSEGVLPVLERRQRDSRGIEDVEPLATNAAGGESTS
jgi:hypothetical protein